MMEEMSDLEMDRYYIEEAMDHEEQMMAKRALEHGEDEESLCIQEQEDAMREWWEECGAVTSQLLKN
jgi:hypothetical protein